jgi:hypothetical protein
MLSSTLVANAEEPFRSAKTDIAKDLADLGVTATADFDSHDQKKLDKALRHLDKGLAEKYWSEDGSTLVGKGEHVFRYDAKAIRDLQKIDGPDVDDIIDRIVILDREMAEAAVAAAKAAGADITKVEQTMAKAAEALEDGNISKAVDLYGTAWRNAGRAKAPKAPKTPKTATAASSSNGKYSTYDVVFVRTDTAGTASPVFLSVSGSNQSGTAGYTGRATEGYLFSSEFGPGETFLDPSLWPSLEGGIMQLHVSCSDVFAGGFGSKSDPAATSQWMINSIHIVKHQGESTDKECEVIGAGLPTPPTDTATSPPPATITTTPPCDSVSCWFDA